MNINEKDFQIQQTPKFFKVAFILGILGPIASVVGGILL